MLQLAIISLINLVLHIVVKKEIKVLKEDIRKLLDFHKKD